MITVDEKEEVAAFANYKAEAVGAAVSAPDASYKPAESTTNVVAAAPIREESVPSSSRSNSSRVFASPFAKKLAKESGVDLSVAVGSGPNGRIVAVDVQKLAAVQTQVSVAPVVTQQVPLPQANKQTPPIAGVFADFLLSEVAQTAAARHTLAKQHVPHYYLSVELNLSNLLKLREQFNKQFAAKRGDESASAGLSVQDFLIKAAALSMKQVC